MTVETTTNKKRVQGDGVTTAIPYTLRVQSVDDLKVYKITRATSVSVLQTGGGVDYTATVNSEGTGGTVTMTTAPSSLYDILILNQLALTQPADLPTEGNFSEVTVEEALDRSRLIDIQQQEEINRCLKLKSEDVLNTNSYAGLYITAEATADRQDRVVKWNAAGTEMEAGPTTTNLETLAAIADDISAVAAIDSEVTVVAAIDSEITTVAGISANVSTVAGISSGVTTVAGISANVSTVAGIASDVSAVAAIASDVTLVASLTPPLASIAGLTTSANQMIYTTASNTYATTGLTAAARSVLDDSTINDMVNTLGGTSSTGTGGLVRLNTPTLESPHLGTPSSGNLNNCTGLPVSTGISGLGTGVSAFLATPSSGNLRSALTDETGTGAAVFATSPTLVTPTLGAASADSVNLTGSAGPANGFYLPSGNTVGCRIASAYRFNIDGSGIRFMNSPGSGNPSSTLSGTLIADPQQTSPNIASAGTTTTTVPLWQFYNGNGQVGNITVNGSATSYATSSDKRAKTEINKLEESGEILDRITAYKFKWKVDNAEDYGVFAQDIYEVLPQAVPTVGDSSKFGSKNYRGWAVDYSKFVPILIAEVKSIRARLSALEASNV